MLENGVVDYKPTVRDMTLMIDDVCRSILTVITVVPRVEEVLPVEVKGGYNATEAAITAMAAKASSAGGFGGGTRPGAAAGTDSKDADVAVAATSTVPAQPTFYDIISQEASVQALLQDIMAGFGRIIARPPGVASKSDDEDLTTHKESFGNFGHLWQVDRGRWMARYAKVRVVRVLRDFTSPFTLSVPPSLRQTSRPLSQIEVDIMKFVTTEADIKASIQVSTNILFIRVDHSLLRQALIEHCQQWVRHFTRLLNDNARRELDSLHSLMADAAKALAGTPTTLDGLSRNMKLVKQMRRDRSSVEEVRLLPVACARWSDGPLS